MTNRRQTYSYERMIAGPPGRRVNRVFMTTDGRAAFVAIIDDEELMRRALEGLLKGAGFAVRTFASAEEFLDAHEHRQAACLIADIRMPGMSGLDLQARLNDEGVKIPTIFITAHGDARMRMQALRAGAVEFLTKPFDDEVLLDSLRAAMQR